MVPGLEAPAVVDRVRLKPGARRNATPPMRPHCRYEQAVNESRNRCLCRPTPRRCRMSPGRIGPAAGVGRLPVGGRSRAVRRRLKRPPPPTPFRPSKRTRNRSTAWDRRARWRPQLPALRQPLPVYPGVGEPESVRGRNGRGAGSARCAARPTAPGPGRTSGGPACTRSWRRPACSSRCPPRCRRRRTRPPSFRFEAAIAVAVHVGQDDEAVVPLEDAQGVGGVRERRPVRYRGAEGRVELVVRPQVQALGDAPVDAREQLRIAQVRRGLLLPALALREGAEPGVGG